MNHPQSISQVLADTKISQMSIPIFQREYSWKQKEANQLFDDLVETIDSQRNALLGLLVLIQSSESGHRRSLQIVDGQQRITTISILIAILRRKLIGLSTELSPMQQHKVWAVVGKLGDCILRKEDDLKPLLQFHESSLLHAQLFSGLLLSRVDLPENFNSVLTDLQLESLKKKFQEENKDHEALLSWISDKSNFNQTKAKAKNVRKNFLALGEAVESHLEDCNDANERLESLLELSEVLLSRFTVINYETTDEEEAFFLFETLNDRGMAVAASDLIKNFCIQKDTENIEEIGHVWNEIFKKELPDKTQPMYFLRTFHNSQQDFTTKKDLFAKFKIVIRGGNISPSSWLRTIVLPDAKRFKTLSSEWQLIPSPRLKNIFACLNATNSKQWQTVALSSLRLLDDKDSAPKIRKEIEHLLYEVLVGAIILELKSKRGSLLEKKLPEIARELHEAIRHSEEAVTIQAIKSITESFNKYRHEQDLDGTNLKETLLEGTYENASMRPLLTFLRLHDLNEGDYVGITTVEHVFPQNPDSKDDWPSWYSSNEIDVDTLTKSLGNFINITGETNSSLNNASFELKKKGYTQVNAPDPVGVDSSHHWSNVEDWTPSVVKARAAEVATRLSELLST